MNDREKRKRKEQRGRQKAAHAAKRGQADEVRTSESTGASTIVQRKGDKKPQHADEDAAVAKLTLDRWTVRLTGASSLLTLATVIVSVLALNASTKTTKLDERAWLGVSKIEGPSKLAVLSDFVFSIQITNTGKTPALHISELTMFKTLEVPDVFDPKAEIAAAKQTPERKGSLHPQTGFFIPMDMSAHVAQPDHPEIRNVISEATFQRIRERKANYYVFGILNYSDVFGDEAHTTTFCFKLQLVTDPPTFGTDAVCDGFSDYTEQKRAD